MTTRSAASSTRTAKLAVAVRRRCRLAAPSVGRNGCESDPSLITDGEQTMFPPRRREAASFLRGWRRDGLRLAAHPARRLLCRFAAWPPVGHQVVTQGRLRRVVAVRAASSVLFRLPANNLICRVAGRSTGVQASRVAMCCARSCAISLCLLCCVVRRRCALSEVFAVDRRPMRCVH